MFVIKNLEKIFTKNTLKFNKNSKKMGRQKPNLATTIGLYAGGILLIILAILLLLQAIGLISSVSNTVYLALALLALGCGLLYGIASKT